MKQVYFASIVVLTLGIMGCMIVSKSDSETANTDVDKMDPYIWLEEVEGDSALNWVREQNRKTVDVLEQDSRFAQFEQEALHIYEAKDKLAYGRIRGDYIYNFWQDESHVRGVWRRSLLQSYLNNTPDWEVILDIDVLAEKEGENWVYKGTTGLPPTYNRFLIQLSRGGKDAVVVREFDMTTRQFISDGFEVPEAKSDVAWISEDQVFLATDFGSGSMTESGYPATLRIWNRGESLQESEEIASVNHEDLGVWGWSSFYNNGSYKLVSKAKDFWSHEIFLMNDQNGLDKLDIPLDVKFRGIWQNQICMILRSDWRGHTAGSFVAMDLITQKTSEVFVPDSRSSISDDNMTDMHILLTIQEDVIDKVYRASFSKGSWKLEDMSLPYGGTISIMSTNIKHSDFFYTYNDLITPVTLGYFANAESDPQVIRQSPARFDSEGLKVTQKFAISKDGTRVPYFLVMNPDIPRDGSNPTLLYGYGGFEVSEKSEYWSKTGKLWLEKGGVFALANIRGGGEYGPAWHQAALKTNRHKSYEDFFAIAEDMIESGITSPQKLGIMGGSGGGLLVGAAFTMRPDLFGAVVSQVPLLDMMRYHKLLAGASWMGEYGDPDDPVEGAYLQAHSPYHLLSSDQSYPKVMFTTSTKDDRVHPGHARKMVARMMEQGHPVMYYENMEGGHAAGANLKQYATMASIEMTYLHRMLMPE